MIAESLLGGIFGGLLRLAPEVLKFLDKKNERAHELAMLNVEVEIVKHKVQAEMYRADAAMATSAMDAVSEALKGQAEMAKAAGKFIAGISAAVRPVVTYWFTALYSFVKIGSMYIAYQANASFNEIMSIAWTEQDWAIFSMILSFWFVGRVWERISK